MKHGFIKVAAITPAVRVADCEYNAAQIKHLTDEALKTGAKLIVCPELCITAATCGDLFFQNTLTDAAWQQLQLLTAHTAKTGSDAVYFLGLPVEVQGKLYDTCAVVQAGKLLALIPREKNSAQTPMNPARQFACGTEDSTIISVNGEAVPFGRNLLLDLNDTVKGLVIGVEIGEGLFLPDAPHTKLCAAGATLIVNPAAFPDLIGRGACVRDLVRVTSAVHHCAYVLAGAGEGESGTDFVFAGQRIVAENGDVLSEGGLYRAGVTYADIDIDRLNQERKKNGRTDSDYAHSFMKLPVSMERVETELSRTFPASPFLPEEEGDRNRRCEEILTMQAAGLQKRMEHIGCKKAVIGVSGGLDSTLAFLVILRAFDRMGYARSDICAVTMPSFGTTDRTYQNACQMVQLAGAELKEINIAEAVRVHFKDIAHPEDMHDTTYENAQARERTQVLMDIANDNGGLVVGTGDLSELALGWATYNGDHMSMYGVNAGVPKTLVRHLVRYCALVTEDEVLRKVLTDVVETPVSPELLPPKDGEIAQKTEDLVGPYELHDFFLYYALRRNASPEKILRIACLTFADRYSKEEIARWLEVFFKRFFSQQFKRSCMPDGVAIGSVALSPRGALAMPSDAVSTHWTKRLLTFS